MTRAEAMQAIRDIESYLAALKVALPAAYGNDEEIEDVDADTLAAMVKLIEE